MDFIKNLKNFTNNHLGGSEKKENIADTYRTPLQIS